MFAKCSNSPKTFYSCLKSLVFMSVNWPVTPKCNIVLSWCELYCSKCSESPGNAFYTQITLVCFFWFTLTAYCTIKEQKIYTYDVTFMYENSIQMDKTWMRLCITLSFLDSDFNGSYSKSLLGKVDTVQHFNTQKKDVHICMYVQ